MSRAGRWEYDSVQSLMVRISWAVNYGLDSGAQGRAATQIVAQNPAFRRSHTREKRQSPSNSSSILLTRLEKSGSISKSASLA